MSSRASLLQIFRNQTTTRELRKRVPLAPGYGDGFRTVPDGEEELVYNVWLDQGALAAMARQAAGHRNQKSKAGPVLVSVTARRRLAVQGKL